jgi:tetraacyldisaccharide 4'-kinase
VWWARICLYETVRASRGRDFTVVNAAQSPSDGLGSASHDAIQMELLGVVAERLCDRSQRLALTSGLLVPDTNHHATRIVAAAGIGNPARFFSMLRAAGLTIDEMALADHYDFANNPFAAVLADIILITEKDAVKCDQIASLKNDPRLWVVPVAARIDVALAEQIVEKLRGHTTA